MATLDKTVLGEGVGLPGKMPLSLGLQVGDFVFTAGQVPYDEDGNVIEGGIEVQTRVVMERIKSILAEAGCTMDDVVKTHCYLQDTRDFERFNKTYGEYFGDKPPVRTTVRVDLIFDMKVEVEAIAYKPR